MRYDMVFWLTLFVPFVGVSIVFVCSFVSPVERRVVRLLEKKREDIKSPLVVKQVVEQQNSVPPPIYSGARYDVPDDVRGLGGYGDWDDSVKNSRFH